MKSRSGFTIVELLIVIVIIGVLASVTIVAYNGVQRSAKLSVAKSDLSILSKKSALSNITNGSFPNTPAEISTLFKDTNMFENTRVAAQKSFVICSFTSGMTYTIIAIAPVSITDTNGQELHYVDQTGAKTFVWNSAATSGTFSAERACRQTTNGFEFALWSYDLT